MSTIEQEPIVGEIVANNIHAPIRFNVSDEAIRGLRKKLTGLKADTPSGYLCVKTGIAEVRTLRVGVESKRKQLKEDALKYGRMVDGEAKRITDALSAIEEPLKAEKDKADNAKELAKKMEQEARQRALQVRIDTLDAVGFWKNPIIVEAWSEDEYKAELATATDLWETKLRREAAEKAEAEKKEADRIESVRLEKIQIEAERAELAKLKAEAKAKQEEADAIMRSEQEKLAAERKAMEAEKRALELQRLVAERIEQDRIDQIERAEYEAEQARLTVVAKEQEAKRLEALKPDAEKLRVLGDTLRLLAYPEMATEEGREALRSVVRHISETAEYCHECLA